MKLNTCIPIEPDERTRQAAELESIAAQLAAQIDELANSIEECRGQLAQFREQLQTTTPTNNFRLRLRLSDVADESGPPTFSLRRMFAVVCFVALAMKLEMEFNSAVICFVCGGAVGAAVFSLARRPLFGVLVGVAAQVFILIVLNVFFHIRIR